MELLAFTMERKSGVEVIGKDFARNADSVGQVRGQFMEQSFGERPDRQ
jgi:hypothetical protein